MRKYQGVFILIPPADESALEARLEAIGKEISRQGGVVQATTRMGRTAFARPLRKRESGFYALIAFEIEPARLSALRERLKLDENILRSQIMLAPPAAEQAGKAPEQAGAPAAAPA